MKKRIKNYGLTITWVADKINIPRPTLNSYLNGFRTMPLEVERSINQLLKKYE